MDVKTLLKMDMGEAIEWLTENADDFVIIPKEDIEEIELNEIRPEKAGELWRGDLTGTYYHTEIFEQRLVWTSGGRRLEIMEDDFQPKSMTRLFPPVEDDSVERIEIDVTCVAANVLNRSSKSTYQFELPDGHFERILKGSPILEIRKGLTKHP